jgi:hypothetical protein
VLSLRLAAWFVASLAFSILLAVTPAAAQGRAPVVDPPATSPGDPSYAEELVVRARALRLDADVQWLRLGHYYKGSSGDWRSEPDGPLFWLAPDGPTNPSAELEATIRAIWSPEPADMRDQHPFCRFPARMMWLDEHLGLDTSRMPVRDCPRWREFHDRLRAESIALIFSSYYLSSPASAFGHTFLRIHKAGVRRENELLDTGIDYSATVDTGNALAYAIKGLMGMFAGTFHSVPYFYKVREYNDYDSRDLWEYELDLSPRAVQMVVAHLWEEGSTYFAYYYLSENCSYHILRVIEASDPKLDLMSHVKYPVLPVDTVRALFADPGLVREVRYRPSLRSQFRWRTGRMTGDQQAAVAAVADDPTAPLPASLSDRQRADVLDAATDLVDMRYSTELIKGGDPRPAQIKLALLERRAAIPLASDDGPVPTPFDKMPHAGHATSRAGLGVGYSPEVDGFYELHQRLALHDLADSADGYPETSLIEFLPFKLRFYPKARSLELEDASIVRVLSLAPWDRFSHGLSWTVRAGGTRLRDAGCDGCFVGLGQVAMGASFALARDRVVLFGMADGEVTYWPALHGIGDSPARLGVGPLGGMRLRFDPHLEWVTTAGWQYLPLAKVTQQTYAIDTALRWEIAPNVALGIEGRKQPTMMDGVFAAYLYY